MRLIRTVTDQIDSQSRSEMIEITQRVQRLISMERIVEGIAILYVPHTTAAITINENADPDVKHDLLKKLEMLIPQREPYYRHNEGNSDSHVKTSLVGNMVTVLIERGQLLLGKWQGIQFCEFDGPRKRKVIVKLFSLDRLESD